MEGSEKQITKTQLFCLIIITGLASAVLALPSVLAAEAGRDLWLSALTGFAVYAVIFFIIVRIYKLNPDAGLYTVIQKNLGSLGAKIIYGLLALFFGFKTLMLFCETEEFCAARLYDGLPWYFYAAVLGALAVFMAVKGLKTIARCNELSLVFVIAALLVCISAAAGQMEPARLFPVLEKGFAPVFRSFYKTAAWYGDFLIILMAMGKIKPDKKLPRVLYAAYGAAAVIAAAFCFVYYALYGKLSGFQGHGEALPNIINFSKDSSMGLISAAFNQIWLLACFLKLTAMFWAANEALGKAAGLKKPVYTAPPLAAVLYILNIFVFKNIDAVIYAALKYASYFTAGVCFILPPVILICAARYKKRRERGAWDI